MRKYFAFFTLLISNAFVLPGLASDAKNNVGDEKVSSAAAKQLVLNVEIVKEEFKKNSTCTIEKQSTFSKDCQYLLFEISCTPGKDDPGLLNGYVVNKRNADVKKLGLDGGLISEQGLSKLQNAIRTSNGITDGDVEKYRDISIVGCLAY